MKFTVKIDDKLDEGLKDSVWSKLKIGDEDFKLEDVTPEVIAKSVGLEIECQVSDREKTKKVKEFMKTL